MFKCSTHHTVISFVAAGLLLGKNQKKYSLVSFAALLMGSKPAYDSPISNATSGSAAPSTRYSRFLSLTALSIGTMLGLTLSIGVQEWGISLLQWR